MCTFEYMANIINAVFAIVERIIIIMGAVWKCYRSLYSLKM